MEDSNLITCLSYFNADSLKYSFVLWNCELYCNFMGASLLNLCYIHLKKK